ncbi:MAG: LysR family transcriptional regulator [Anderseniella sp.]
MHIDQLKDFVTFSETRNFTKTAERRNTTQPNVSKRIRALEHWIGISLLDREQRPVELTEDGLAFLPKAIRVLEQLQEAQAGRHNGTAHAPRIKIAMPHSASTHILPALKQRFFHSCTASEFSMWIGNHDDVAEHLRRSECDLALAYVHDRVSPAEEFVVYRPVTVAHDDLVMVRCSACADPQGQSLFVPHRETYLGRVWQEVGATDANTQIIEFGLPADIRALCVAGEGVGVLPLSVVEQDLASGVLTQCKGSFPVPYSINLYCSVRASASARMIWQSMADHASQLSAAIPIR